MKKVDPPIINVSQLKEGQTVSYVNLSSSAQILTFKNGEYGEISFTLIVGAECKIVVGTIPPVIIINDTDENHEQNIRKLKPE